MTVEHRADLPANVQQAVGVLSSLRVGDPVIVTVDEKGPLAMRVSVAARRADGAFGSEDSTRVTVSLGVGRWSTEVVADRMIERRGLPRRFRIEPDVWMRGLERLTAATTLGELVGIRGRYNHPDTDSGTNGRGALRTPVWSAEHEALHALRHAQLSAVEQGEQP